MFKEYFKERENLECRQTEAGFALYRANGDLLFISDLYIVPERRRDGAATHLVDSLIKDIKPKIVRANVQKNARNHVAPLMALSAYGFKVLYEDSNTIQMSKEIA